MSRGADVAPDAGDENPTFDLQPSDLRLAGNRLLGAPIAPIAVPLALGVNAFGSEIGPFALDAGLRRRLAHAERVPAGGTGRLGPLTLTDVPPALPPPDYGDARLKNREPILTTSKRLARWVRAAIDDGRPHHLLCLAVAGWLRFLRGADSAGEEVPIQGPRPDLVPIAQDAGGDATPLLSERSVFDHIGQDPRFAECVQRALSALDRQGPREVIEEFLAAGGPA